MSARAMNGPDVSGIFIGDGGIFGIKVEASYRMHHLPKFTKGSARAWDEGDLEGCFAAYYELWENDPHLYMQSYSSGMILGPEYMGMVEPKAPPQWILWFLHVGNSEEEVELKYKNCEAVCARHGGKVASPAILEFASGFLQWAHDMNKMATLGLEPLLELIVSRRDILECFKWSREYLFKELADHGIDKSKIPYITGLLSSGPGYGMTTVIPYLDQSDPERLKAIREIWMNFLEQARRRGYGIEATQGHMSREMAKSWTPEFYHFIRTMKQRMDPNNIMNPGVFFD